MSVAVLSAATLFVEQSMLSLFQLLHVSSCFSVKTATTQQCLTSWLIDKALACFFGAALPPWIVNIGGGALAMVHPIGA